MELFKSRTRVAYTNAVGDKVYPVIVDIKRGIKSTEEIQFMSSDINTGILSVAFIQGNENYNVSGAEVVCSVMRPDASTLDIPCTIVENNIVEVPLGINGTSQDGIYSFDFKVFKDGNKVVGTPIMNYSVSLSISNDNAVLEDDRLPVLTMLMTQVSELHDRTDEAVVKANTATEATKVATANAIEATTTANETINKVTQDTANAIAEVNATSDTMVENVNNAISSMDTTVNNKISEMTATVNNKISEVDTAKNDMINDVSSTKANMVTEVTNAKDEMTATVTNKVNEVEARFNALTSSQQQAAEVIDARDGETSLKARLDRDIEKAKQVYVNVEGSHISTDSSVGYLKDVEILGNTIQDQNNLADIRSVGDKVEGQELYEIPVVSCGKNLINPKLQNGSISDSTGNFGSSANYTCDKTYYKVKPNTTYVFTCNTNRDKVYLYDKDKNFIKFINIYSNNVFSTTENTEYLRYRFHNPNPETIGEIQLEEGTVATPYEPYVEDKLTILSPVQLEKVGDVADRIIEKDGVWGVEKNVIDKLFNGSENWVLSGWAPQENTIAFKLQNTNNTNLGICDKFILNRNNSTIDTEAFNVDSVWNEISIRINKSKLSTQDVTGFKKWLSDNTVLVMYSDNTPTFIPLPHDQQVKLRTFANKTNISFLTEIEGTIKAQVPKSLGATVNTHTEQINSLNKELDRVKKLEESTVSTVTTESDFTTVEATSNGYFEDVKLEGKTLVNLLPKINFTPPYGGNKQISDYPFNFKKANLVSNKLYTICIYGDISILQGYVIVTNVDGKDMVVDLNSNGTALFKFVSELGSSPISKLHIYGKNNTTELTETYLNSLSVSLLEGDHTQNPPNFFEGLKSVGDGADEIVVSSVNGDGNLFDKTQLDVNGTYVTSTGSVLIDSDLERRATNFIRVKPNTTYTFYGIANSGVTNGGINIYIREYDINKNVETGHISSVTSDVITIHTGGNTHYIRTTIRTPDIDRCVLKVGDVVTGYTPHQSDKKRLLYYNEETQTWEKPILREWDSIEKHSDGKYYYHKRCEEAVFDGSEDEGWTKADSTDVGYSRFFNGINSTPDKYFDADVICDKLPTSSNRYLSDALFDCIGGVSGNNRINIKYSGDLTVSDLTNKLSNSPHTVVYQLAEEKVYECTNIDLITYANETNYIVESGAISPKSTLKVHNNISNVVKILQEKVSLLESNVKSSQEVQDMMILETDMRMLDIELALMEFAPMKLNLGGSDMLRSATYFNFLKNHIINETYEKEYLENVMNKYLATGRINQDEYDELYKMLYPPVYDIELPIEL